MNLRPSRSRSRIRRVRRFASRKVSACAANQCPQLVVGDAVSASGGSTFCLAAAVNIAASRFVSAGLASDVTDPVINLRFDPDGTFWPKGSRSREPAIAHALIDCGPFEADPSDDLGQAEKPSGGKRRRHGIVDLGKSIHRVVQSSEISVPSEADCVSGRATCRCRGPRSHRYVWPASAPRAAKCHWPSAAERPRPFARACVRGAPAAR